MIVVERQSTIMKKVQLGADRPYAFAWTPNIPDESFPANYLSFMSKFENYISSSEDYIRQCI